MAKDKAKDEAKDEAEEQAETPVNSGIPVLGQPVETFDAYDRATGKKITVDHRTFDPALHSRKKVKAAE